MPNDTLQVTEIYPSIQGESSYTGKLCTFIRLSGCPLRCRWCDTAYAFKGGQEMTVAEIVAEVYRIGISLVELTGGEPLAQKLSASLVHELSAAGYQILIETGGSESIQPVVDRAHVIMDIKCPDSGMADRNLLENIACLKPSDEVKFVVASRQDFDWALQLIEAEGIASRASVLFSAAFGLVDPKDLVTWMLEKKAPGRLNLQVHKYIWSPRAKGV